MTATGILSPGQRHVRGSAGRKVSNALTLDFAVDADTTVATSQQGGGDGTGRKLGVLFGFKNGGVGQHSLVGANGVSLIVETREVEPALVRTETGEELGQLERAETSTARAADGSVVFTVVPAEDGAKHHEVFKLQLVDAAGARLATLEIIRTAAGWSLGRELTEDLIWFGHAGQPLKIPFLGSLLTFDRDPTPIEGDLALAVCVDIVIGIRPHVSEMR